MRSKMKILLTTVLMLLVNFNVSAAQSHEKPRVAVMIFGQHYSLEGEIRTKGVGAALSEYIIEALTDSNRFEVVGVDRWLDVLAEKNLEITGIITQSQAREIAELINTRYIIYGNVSGVDNDTLSFEIISNGADIHTVKSLAIGRMMDAKTGDIVTVARGEGQSKSSRVKISAASVGYLTIGTARVSQVSVHNSIKKAAFAMVDLLIKRLDEDKFFEEFER